MNASNTAARQLALPAQTDIQAQTLAESARLAELRYTVLDAVNYSPYTTADEKATAAHRVANCHNAEVLVKWYCNVLTLLAARELAPPVPVAYATADQQQEIVRLCNRAEITKAEKTAALLGLPRLTDRTAKAMIGLLWAWVVERAQAPGQRRAIGGKAIAFNQ